MQRLAQETLTAGGPAIMLPLPAEEFHARSDGTAAAGSVLDAHKTARYIFRYLRDELLAKADEIVASTGRSPTEIIRASLKQMLERVVPQEEFDNGCAMIARWVGTTGLYIGEGGRMERVPPQAAAEREALARALALLEHLYDDCPAFADPRSSWFPARYHGAERNEVAARALKGNALEAMAPFALPLGDLTYFEPIFRGSDARLLKFTLQQRFLPLAQEVTRDLTRLDGELVQNLREQAVKLLALIPAEVRTGADRELLGYLEDCERAWGVHLQR